jgi:hypothetical protein
MNRARPAIIALIALVAVGAAALVSMRRHRSGAATVGAPADVRAPQGVRVRVQVLNGTKIRGLARRATMLLRDRGFDVVETGTINEARDTTLVLDLSGHPEWATRVARLFGTPRIEARRDSSRYLDITVVLGATWRPPTEPFYP